MDGDSIHFGTISRNTPIRTAMETSAAINAAEGNEEESGSEKASPLITIGLKNSNSAVLSANMKVDGLRDRAQQDPPGTISNVKIESVVYA